MKTTDKALERYDRIAALKLAVSSESSYRTWIVKFLKFAETPRSRAAKTSEERLEMFLAGMAHNDYSRTSQEQAFHALMFLYKHVLKIEVKDVDALRCRRGTHERYVPTQAEISAMFAHLKNTPTYNVRLLVALLYACGLRVQSGCELRIKDFDLDRMALTVHMDKGNKDRQIAIPESLLPAIRRQLARATALAQLDIDCMQPVQLPGRMDVKAPSKQFEIGWHFLFPSPHPCPHPRTKKIVRWCIGPDVIQRAVKRAARLAGIPGKITPHCLRHSYCSDLMDAGHSPRRVQEAMGHADIRTTMGYARKECLDLPSPIENLKRRSA